MGRQAFPPVASTLVQKTSNVPGEALTVSSTRSAPFIGDSNIRERICVSQNQKLVRIVAKVVTPPTSAGTYQLLAGRVREGSGDVSVLASAFDLKSLSAETRVNVPLTSTKADLQFIADDELILKWESDNADLAGAGLRITAIFELG